MLGFGRGFGEGRAKTLEFERDIREEKKRRELFSEDIQLKKARIDATNALAERRRGGGVFRGGGGGDGDIDTTLFKKSLDSKGNVVIKSKSQTERLNDAVNRAKAGEITFDEVKEQFPFKETAIEKIRLGEIPRATKARGFIRGTGGLESRRRSFFSSQQAELNTETLELKNKLVNVEDVAELVRDFREDPKQFKDAKVDMEALFEFFGLPKDISPENVLEFFKSRG